jgi:hypothetical protein
MDRYIILAVIGYISNFREDIQNGLLAQMNIPIIDKHKIHHLYKHFIPVNPGDISGYSASILSSGGDIGTHAGHKICVCGKRPILNFIDVYHEQSAE